MSSAKLEILPVEEIELDKDNPRIKSALEYKDTLTAEDISLALGAGRTTGEDGTKFTTLKNSILASRGIVQPIIVNRTNGRLVCIEGNTRVAIYREFAAEGYAGDWTTIPAMVHDDLEESNIDSIRLQVHLVGPRPWDAYSKAKYLHHLRTKELLTFDRIVDFCGGKTRDVQTSIQAYTDMERYYRPLVDDQGFDISRFSGFVEFQKYGNKDALLENGFGPADFARWVVENKFERLEHIRQLAKVMRSPKARSIFLRQNMKKAMEALDRPELEQELQRATVGQLARALAEALGQIPTTHVIKMRRNEDEETAQSLFDAFEALQMIVEEIRG